MAALYRVLGSGEVTRRKIGRPRPHIRAGLAVAHRLYRASARSFWYVVCAGSVRTWNSLLDGVTSECEHTTITRSNGRKGARPAWRNMEGEDTRGRPEVQACLFGDCRIPGSGDGD